MRRLCLPAAAIAFTACLPAGAQDIDFNLDVRPILSNKCLLCHGPDPEGVQAGLRLDQRDAAVAELESGMTAVVPSKPEESELIARIVSEDEDLRMPPAEHGARLTDKEVDILRRWIQQDAPYAVHWSYVKPQRPEPPESTDEHSSWSRNPIDLFVLQRLTAKGLTPSAPADRYALSRRVCLDLTGLPPSVEEVDKFVNSTDPDAYEKYVDDLLNRPAFGEHWARKWLDLARYADSAGYADDPPRTIWAYRDWVIRSINANMPFDQFTTEQLAGDLLPDPTENQLIATAFHRNTLTNNEGGTQDEEFRNVAVVDRVNTTMAVWMGTTMACAQCHTHKYDPITQEEYFRFFAVFNNTEDADRRNESPTIQIFTEEQRRQQHMLTQTIARLEKTLASDTPELRSSQTKWEAGMASSATWKQLVPTEMNRASGLEAKILENGVVTATVPAEKDTYRLTIPVGEETTGNSPLAAIRIETQPDEMLPGNGSGWGGGNFVVTGIRAQLVPDAQRAPRAKFVRITNPGRNQILSLAEVQVMSEGDNIATRGTASQSSTGFNGPAQFAIDGNTDGLYEKMSVTHTLTSDDPWWELELSSAEAVDRIIVWNRTDNNLESRLEGFRIELLDEQRNTVWSKTDQPAPKPSLPLSPINIKDISFKSAFADYHQDNFDAADALSGKTGNMDGWAIAGQTNRPHQLTLVPTKVIRIDEPSSLRLIIEQNSPHSNHLIGRFAVSVTDSTIAIERSRMPDDVLRILDTEKESRSAKHSAQLAAYYRSNLAPELSKQRRQLAKSKQKQLALKPSTSVPVLRELTKNRRDTHLQHRGSYLDKGQKVTVGFPAIFHPAPEENIDRHTVSKWLTSPENPLTSRVIANRYWETIFGRGIVLTSEEFGSQGELPTHPKLLDWLATELQRNNWNTKQFLKLLVTSATYRQSAKVTESQRTADPDNRWLSRGPRVRLSAEMVRDQALAASGLLSDKMYGPPVKPPQPDMGLKAAFGGSTDWKTSTGEDRYRRGIYTTWRRSNPYPSMATFDAPNREVCTVRRNSTNTPLQSLVTLNDPVYVEAAQALARAALQSSTDLNSQLVFAFRKCLLRPPTDAETETLTALFRDSMKQFADQPEEAMALATEPLGKLPTGLKPPDAAAMTVVCNVLLNLDEMFLKR